MAGPSIGAARAVAVAAVGLRASPMAIPPTAGDRQPAARGHGRVVG
jgi:hypothetical protein